MSFDVKQLPKRILGITLFIALFLFTGCDDLYGTPEKDSITESKPVATIGFESKEEFNEAIADCQTHGATFETREEDGIYIIEVEDVESLDEKLVNAQDTQRGWKKKWYTGKFPAGGHMLCCAHTKQRTWTRSYIRLKSFSVLWGAAFILVKKGYDCYNDHRCLGHV